MCSQGSLKSLKDVSLFHYIFLLVVTLFCVPLLVLNIYLCVNRLIFFIERWRVLGQVPYHSLCVATGIVNQPLQPWNWITHITAMRWLVVSHWLEWPLLLPSVEECSLWLRSLMRFGLQSNLECCGNSMKLDHQQVINICERSCRFFSDTFPKALKYSGTVQMCQTMILEGCI